LLVENYVQPPFGGPSGAAKEFLAPLLRVYSLTQTKKEKKNQHNQVTRAHFNKTSHPKKKKKKHMHPINVGLHKSFNKTKHGTLTQHTYLASLRA
jgi:hypothetical protein